MMVRKTKKTPAMSQTVCAILALQKITSVVKVITSSISLALDKNHRPKESKQGSKIGEKHLPAKMFGYVYSQVQSLLSLSKSNVVD